MFELDKIISYIEAIEVDREQMQDSKYLSSMLRSDFSTSIKSLDDFNSLDKNEKIATLLDILFEVVSRLDEKTQRILSSVSLNLANSDLILDGHGIGKLFDLFSSDPNPAKDKIKKIILSSSVTVTRKKLLVNISENSSHGQPAHLRSVLSHQLPDTEIFNLNRQYSNNIVKSMFKNTEFTLQVKIQSKKILINQTPPKSGALSVDDLFYIDVNYWELSAGDSIFIGNRFEHRFELRILETNSNIIRFNLERGSQMQEVQNSSFSFGSRRDTYYYENLDDNQIQVNKVNDVWSIKNNRPSVQMMVGMLNLHTFASIPREFKLKTRVTRYVSIHGSILQFEKQST